MNGFRSHYTQWRSELNWPGTQRRRTAYLPKGWPDFIDELAQRKEIAVGLIPDPRFSGYVIVYSRVQDYRFWSRWSGTIDGYKARLLERPELLSKKLFAQLYWK